MKTFKIFLLLFLFHGYIIAKPGVKNIEEIENIKVPKDHYLQKILSPFESEILIQGLALNKEGRIFFIMALSQKKSSFYYENNFLFRNFRSTVTYEGVNYFLYYDKPAKRHRFLKFIKNMLVEIPSKDPSIKDMKLIMRKDYESNGKVRRIISEFKPEKYASAFSFQIEGHAYRGENKYFIASLTKDNEYDKTEGKLFHIKNNDIIEISLKPFNYSYTFTDVVTLGNRVFVCGYSSDKKSFFDKVKRDRFQAFVAEVNGAELVNIDVGFKSESWIIESMVEDKNSRLILLIHDRTSNKFFKILIKP